MTKAEEYFQGITTEHFTLDVFKRIALLEDTSVKNVGRLNYIKFNDGSILYMDVNANYTKLYFTESENENAD